MEMQNTSITLQEQVNLIWLSKVITDIKTLNAKTGIRLIDIHDILKNEKNILEQWKKKCTKNNVKYSPHTDDWDGIDALLLEWIARYKRNNITLTASAINNQVERLKKLLEIPSYKIRNKTWYKINEIFNPQSDFEMSGETSIQDPIQILMTYGSRLLKARIYHKFVAIYKRTYGKSEGKVIDNNKNENSIAKNEIEFVAIEDNNDVTCQETPNEDICNDAEIVELSDDMINNGNDPLFQEPIHQQKMIKNNSACSSSDFPPLTTITIDYKTNHRKEANTLKKPPNNINNKTNIGLTLNENENEEFLEGDQHEFEEFISIDAEEKGPLNTKAIELATLTNPEVMETVEEDNGTENQSQDSIYMNDKTEKCSIEIEVDYNSLQQFIEQQDSNEIEIIENNEDEEDIEVDESLYQKQDICANESSTNTNSNDLQQIKVQENLNTKVIENDESEKIELVYEIDESDDEDRNELFDILNKYTNKVSKENSIEVEKEIQIEPPPDEEDDPLKEVEDVDHHLEITADGKVNNDNDNEIIIENSEKQIKLEKNPLLKIQKRSRRIDDDNVPSTSCSSTDTSLTSDIEKSRLENSKYVKLSCFNSGADVIKYLEQIKDYLISKNDEEGVKLLLKLQMSFVNFTNSL